MRPRISPTTSARGSVARFVAMMNAEARALGLRQTHALPTPIGLDAPGNYSSAADLVKLAEYDLSHSRFFASDRAPCSERPGNAVRYIANLNDLVGHRSVDRRGQDGPHADAGYVMVASGHRRTAWP